MSHGRFKNPVEAVEVLAKRHQIPEAEKASILESFIQGQDYSLWGMSNAVTATANEHSSYDRAVELETLGGEMIAMSKAEWHQIAA